MINTAKPHAHHIGDAIEKEMLPSRGVAAFHGTPRLKLHLLRTPFLRIADPGYDVKTLLPAHPVPGEELAEL